MYCIPTIQPRLSLSNELLSSIVMEFYINGRLLKVSDNAKASSSFSGGFYVRKTQISTHKNMKEAINEEQIVKI